MKLVPVVTIFTLLTCLVVKINGFDQSSSICRSHIRLNREQRKICHSNNRQISSKKFKRTSVPSKKKKREQINLLESNKTSAAIKRQATSVTLKILLSIKDKVEVIINQPKSLLKRRKRMQRRIGPLLIPLRILAQLLRLLLLPLRALLAPLILLLRVLLRALILLIRLLNPLFLLLFGAEAAFIIARVILLIVMIIIRIIIIRKEKEEYDESDVIIMKKEVEKVVKHVHHIYHEPKKHHHGHQFGQHPIGPNDFNQELFNMNLFGGNPDPFTNNNNPSFDFGSILEDFSPSIETRQDFHFPQQLPIYFGGPLPALHTPVPYLT